VGRKSSVLPASKKWLNCSKSTGVMSYRFADLNISLVTIENYDEILTPSLALQVSVFVPPEGSFETSDLQRYLELVKSYEVTSTDLIHGLSLADQIRITFSDMEAATICEKFPDIDLATKRRYRCVAEYLIRQGELTKIKDENNKLVKKLGNMGKMVVIYQPLPKLCKTLHQTGLGQFIKNEQQAAKINQWSA
jgi:hypothetical protein